MSERHEKPEVEECGRGGGFAFIVVLFILLIIVGAGAFRGGGQSAGYCEPCNCGYPGYGGYC